MIGNCVGVYREGYVLLAHDAGGDTTPLGGTDPHTELVVADKRHPLFVKDVLARDVRGDVSTDGVSDVLGSVRVELTTRVTVGDVDLGSVPKTVDLDIGIGLDEL